ncbi:MAG: hypothetical protein QMD06_02650 [Candidatus Altarchaeum sp.]|nr:hypothetical protein [Candidatus Altarchaeum sp.]
MKVKQKNLIGIGILALVVLAITGIVLISGCVEEKLEITFDNILNNETYDMYIDGEKKETVK